MSPYLFCSRRKQRRNWTSKLVCTACSDKLFPTFLCYICITTILKPKGLPKVPQNASSKHQQGGCFCREKGFPTGHEATCTAKQNCKAQQGKMWSWQKYFCTAETSAAPTHTRATFVTSQVSSLCFRVALRNERDSTNLHRD